MSLKVCLINPPQVFAKTQVASGVTPPLGVAYLAAYLLEDGHNVQVIDALGEAPSVITSFIKGSFLRGMNFNDILDRIEPDIDVIGISNLFSFAYPAVELLSKKIKEKFPDKTLILGGPHPTAMYKEILDDVPEVDYVSIGEGEESLLRLLMYIEGKLHRAELKGLATRNENGETVLLESQKRILDLEQGNVPFPARELLPMESYIQTQESHGSSNGRWTSLLSSRGCPYGCTFCFSRRTRWVKRSAKDVVDEMEYCIEKWGIEEFHFEDDNMTINIQRLIEICDEIIRRDLKIKWQTPNGIRASRTNEIMLQKMKDSGCEHITLAPESGSERVLSEIIQKGKDFNLEQLKECGAAAHKIGLKVAAYFILGLPGETRDDMNKTIDYAKQLAKVGVDEAGFGLFIPLPGTPLWDMSSEYVKDMDWIDLLTIGDLGSAVSFNSEVNSDELQKVRRKAYLMFFIYKFRYHPISFVRSIWNVIQDREETKTERSVRQLLQRFNIRKKKYRGDEVKSSVKNVYSYDSNEALKIIIKNVPYYAWAHTARKSIVFLKQEVKFKVGDFLKRLKRK